MIKKISVLLIFALQHFMVFSQASGTSSALDFLNNLPTNTQGMFLGDQGGSQGLNRQIASFKKKILIKIYLLIQRMKNLVLIFTTTFCTQPMHH